MSNRQVIGLIMLSGVLFGCLLGELTRRRNGNPVGSFDVFGWFLAAVALAVAAGIA